MNVVRDIQSLSVFKRDASKIIKQIKATKEPVVLTVNGKAEVVVQDAESYQKLVEAKERAETVAVLRERLADRSGKTKTIDEVFQELADKNGFSLEEEWNLKLFFIRRQFWTSKRLSSGAARSWGKKQAEKWARQFYKTCKKRLSQFPEACPIAPESNELDITIRQLVIDRYRALFVVEGDTVEILYVRGAYIGTMFDDDEENELPS